ncbi:ROK family protein [Bacillus sp. CLL-7-23]|uniref:ROK family protein n=1 Tax=Bacillus changyiensis TaxID=3004103 RepID=A0ABT4X5V4_9BACI|nr:ROK family protein [Bacillus changyiensis]MDA7027679.1 ROK family protein [Bacillus changyiensis]
MTYAVIDLGGTSIKYSIMDENGTMLHSGSTPTPVQGSGETFSALRTIVQTYQTEYDIQGIALSIPGAVDCKTGYVYFAGAVKDIEHHSVKEELSDLKLPIELDNDANCAAAAEKWKGNARGCQNFVCLTVGTGIGGGIFINGEMVRGRNGLAGEFGLMTLQFDDQLHTVVDRYSFSNLASARSLTENFYDQTKQRVNGIELFELAAQGDADAQTAIESFYNALAVGAVNIIHALAPEKILIGGGVSAQTSVIDEVVQRVRQIWPEAVQTTEIDRCFFENEAGKVGALCHYIKQQQTEDDQD